MRRGVALLASPPAEQERWLRAVFAGQRGVVVDELALEVDDLWGSGEIIHASTLTEETRARIDALDRALDAMSGRDHASLWTLSAVHADLGWQRVRGLAAGTLEALSDEAA